MKTWPWPDDLNRRFLQLRLVLSLSEQPGNMMALSVPRERPLRPDGAGRNEIGAMAGRKGGPARQAGASSRP